MSAHKSIICLSGLGLKILCDMQSEYYKDFETRVREAAKRWQQAAAIGYTFDPATGTFRKQPEENGDEITQEIVVKKPTKNSTNEICHFCGKLTVPMIGRQMICKECKR